MLSVLLREVVRVSVHLHSRLNRFWLCWQGIREVNKHFSILKTLGRSGSGHLIHPVCYSVPGSLPSYFTSTILTLLCICRICVYSVSQPIEGTGCEEANICIFILRHNIMDPPDLLGGGGCLYRWMVLLAEWIGLLMNIIFYSLYLSAGLNSAQGFVTSSTILIPKADLPQGAWPGKHGTEP